MTAFKNDVSIRGLVIKTIVLLNAVFMRDYYIENGNLGYSCLLFFLFSVTCIFFLKSQKYLRVKKTGSVKK